MTGQSVSSPNHLKDETSPYLLQHAGNPVDWYPWGEEALEKAQKEDKMMVISIGYAACHWCHVMEHESFEDITVAKMMNEHYISIKVDREERPDVDHTYMDAAMIITGQGGWPLNVITLPDGRPVYAGTYFPKKQWLAVLEYFANLYQNDREKLKSQANKIHEGMQNIELTPRMDEEVTFEPALLDNIFHTMEQKIDYKWGGRKGAPKFPMPSNWEYLLAHYYHTGEKKALDAVTLTLEAMAKGGIYDHLGGGFARYSTDDRWKVPHFEKMLYDNAQLVSLYAKAFRVTGDPLYQKVVYQTLEFIARDLTSDEGGFYSSLDADSEGEEGKYYVWEADELQNLLGPDYDLFAAYYNVEKKGNWEAGKNILYRKLASGAGLDKEQEEKIRDLRKKLLAERQKRVKPGLDDKILTAWNALMITGYLDAYRTFNEKRFLDIAVRNMRFLLDELKQEDHRLNRTHKNGVSGVNAFLDDYGLFIEALINLYQSTFEEKWLEQAKSFTDYVIEHFYDRGTGMFFYKSDLDPALIVKKTDVSDNVIPSSNSVMGRVLFVLGHYYSEADYLEKAEIMMRNVTDQLTGQPFYFSNWAQLLSSFVHRPYEVAIVGEAATKISMRMDDEYLPDVFYLGGEGEGSLPLLEHKLRPGQTTIYVCRNKICKNPVTSVEEAMKQIH